MWKCFMGVHNNNNISLVSADSLTGAFTAEFVFYSTQNYAIMCHKTDSKSIFLGGQHKDTNISVILYYII